MTPDYTSVKSAAELILEDERIGTAAIISYPISTLQAGRKSYKLYVMLSYEYQSQVFRPDGEPPEVKLDYEKLEAQTRALLNDARMGTAKRIDYPVQKLQYGKNIYMLSVALVDAVVPEPGDYPGIE